MPDAKITVEIGNLKFSGEGSEQWLSTEFAVLLDKLEQITSIFPTPAQESSGASGSNGSPKPQVNTDLAINSIAAKLSVKSGSDLLLAACYSLTRGEKKVASRSDLTAEMKRATSFFKTSFTSNLSNYITTLIKDGKLLEQSSDNYAMSAQARSDIESKLA